MADDVLREITEATRRFHAGLDESQRHHGLRPVTDDVLRHGWTYLPGPRAGLDLGDLPRPQRKAVHAMLATVLSRHTYAQVATIMALEDVLDHLEQGRRDRHSGDYWTLLFGAPGGAEPWGWRFEGHHVSVTLTVADGEARATPFFLGANPARIGYADLPVVRPLPVEEELARALLAELGPREREAAVVAAESPPDIHTRDQPSVGPLEPPGVRLADLGSTAADLLTRLARAYTDRLRPELAGPELERLGGELTFAWEGSSRPGTGHYYRIQGPDLLIEYDNTANDANHAHSVWRRPGADFGDDILAAHYAAAHR